MTVVLYIKLSYITINMLGNKANKAVSVIVPFYNESKTVIELHSRLTKTLNDTKIPFEIIFINDGSTDNTFENIRKVHPVKAIDLRKNYGQSAALSIGIKKSQGTIIVTLDSDLENHPEDIPLLLKKIEEGYDLVSGWRKKRWSRQPFSRRFPSILANKLISFVSGIKLHDHGCSLKAYRREILEQLNIKGEDHRIIAAYAAIHGAKIAEMEVNYTPRRYGRSNYGLFRIFKVLLDLVALVFFHKYENRPMHFFGGLGFVTFVLSAISFLIMIYLKFFLKISFISTPLPILITLLAILGVQFVLMGLLAEIIIRKSDQRREHSLFAIKEEISNS